MTQPLTDNGAPGIWSTDQCPFAIEYSRKALDDIRLAVVDAFFSLPRGGAEIGGILLGKVDEQRIRILDYAPIECEHAYGPGFTLSASDQERLGEVLAQSFPGGLRPVGWYHSHTRSEISLSEADLEIHNRYFPERWQVALVLRPSTLQPTQAGFFFREPDGTIQAQNSYQEFVVEALPLQPIVAGGAQAVPGPMRETEPEAVVMTMPAPEPARSLAPPTEAPTPETATAGAETPAEAFAAQKREPEHSVEPEHARVISEAAVAEAPAAPSFESHSQPSHILEPKREAIYEARPPSFLMHAEESPEKKRNWLGIAAGVLAGAALGVAGDQVRSHAQVAPSAIVGTQQAPGLETAAIRKQKDDLARQVTDLTEQNASLRKQLDELSKQQAESAKQRTELSKQQGEASKAQAEASKAQADLKQQRDELAKQAVKLRADLGAQTARAQTLQQQLEDLRRQQQRHRLSIQQNSDPQ